MTPYSPLLIIIIVRIIFIIWKAVIDTHNSKAKYAKQSLPLKRRYKMMRFLFNRNVKNISALFNGHYIDAKALYVLQNGKIPCIAFVGELDIDKAFEHIKALYANDVKQVYQHSYFEHDKSESFFNTIILVMPNQRIIELGNNYCHLLYNADDYQWMRNMCEKLTTFRLPRNSSAAIQIVGFARQSEIINN